MSERRRGAGGAPRPWAPTRLAGSPRSTETGAAAGPKAGSKGLGAGGRAAPWLRPGAVIVLPRDRHCVYRLLGGPQGRWRRGCEARPPLLQNPKPGAGAVAQSVHPAVGRRWKEPGRPARSPLATSPAGASAKVAMLLLVVGGSRTRGDGSPARPRPAFHGHSAQHSSPQQAATLSGVRLCIECGFGTVAWMLLAAAGQAAAAPRGPAGAALQGGPAAGQPSWLRVSAACPLACATAIVRKASASCLARQLNQDPPQSGVGSSMPSPTVAPGAAARDKQRIPQQANREFRLMSINIATAASCSLICTKGWRKRWRAGGQRPSSNGRASRARRLLAPTS